jgi:hypothetical protein
VPQLCRNLGLTRFEEEGDVDFFGV